MEELTLDLDFGAPLAPNPADLEPEERPVRLSYSSISTFELCPLQFKFKYVDKEPGVRTPALAFGESLHEALRRFHHQPVPVAPSLGQLLGYLDEVWDASPYADAREERTYKEHAKQVLAAYHRANTKRFRLPVAIEQRFELPIAEGVTVTGIIDRMDRHPDGSYEIIDYKTNRKLPPKRIVERDLQLSIYALAAREVWGIDARWVSMYYLLPGQKISATRTAEELDATRERIASVAAQIAAAEFPARENRLCNWCDFRAKCPLFAHDAARVAQPDPPDVAAAVEEWISITRRQRADATRLRELGATIAAHLDERGIDRIFGADAAITRRRGGAAYDARALDRLLANGLPDEVKAALRAARDERSIWELELTEQRRRG